MDNSVDEYDDDGAIILGCWKTKAPVTFITMNIASMAMRRWLVIVRIGLDKESELDFTVAG
jgi:hypothetical protein